MQYVEYGAHNLQTIILLHGGGLSWWNYQDAAQLLADKYHVVLPILDGHADSDAPFASLEENAARIITFIDEHFGGKVLALGGLPRLLDIGQCNDAYSAIQIAVALAEAFGCGVNDLPLSMVLSWYEQKAVCILLTLLHLGIKNIRLGPTLPAFISPNVLNFLVEKFNIAPITTPEEDLKAILGNGYKAES